jgi:hypothetical protein
VQSGLRFAPPRQSCGTPILETARALDPCRSRVGRGSMPLLDYGSNGRIRGHQRRLLHVENFFWPPSIESSADRSKPHRSKLLRVCGPGNAQVFSHVCAKVLAARAHALRAPSPGIGRAEQEGESGFTAKPCIIRDAGPGIWCGPQSHLSSAKNASTASAPATETARTHAHR